MHRILYIILLISIGARAETITGFEIVSIYDGDTFHIDLHCQYPVLCKRLPVRVIGIDTPEIRGKCEAEKQKAIAARDYTEAVLLGAENVELHRVKRDGRFRIDAAVMVDGQDLAQLLIDNGMGVAYSGKKARSEDWCE